MSACLHCVRLERRGAAWLSQALIVRAQAL